MGNTCGCIIIPDRIYINNLNQNKMKNLFLAILLLVGAFVNGATIICQTSTGVYTVSETVIDKEPTILAVSGTDVCHTTTGEYRWNAMFLDLFNGVNTPFCPKDCNYYATGFVTLGNGTVKMFKKIILEDIIRLYPNARTIVIQTLCPIDC